MPNIKKLTAIFMFAALFHLAPAFGAETYVNLDRSIAQKCGITFKHPKHWDFAYVKPEHPDELCIIAYRDLTRKKEVIDRPLLQGWLEFADGGLYVQKIPVNERLAEFFFRTGKNGNGVVEYVGAPLTEMAAQDGYTADTIDGMDVIKRGAGTLYVGHAHSAKTKAVNGKITTTERLKTVDLLFGDDAISVGVRRTVSDQDKLRRHRNTIFETIFRSMKLVAQPE
ncbi:MAG: hypothetical protein QM739_12150 [Propionivibrio sp.]